MLRNGNKRDNMPTLFANAILYIQEQNHIRYGVKAILELA
tara:strand:- start:419 stop:538 length:120 start_codon:yes stop_codon:yes gene_type:complete